MNPELRSALENLLHRVRDPNTDVETALRELQKFQEGRVLEVSESLRFELGYEELGYAKVDHARAQRQGFPEVIFCLGKTPTQVAEIAFRLHTHGSSVLATRATGEIFASVQKALPDAKFDPISRLITLRQNDVERPSDVERSRGQVAVLAAGTSDLPVAEEAVGTLEMMGVGVQRIYDVGVAGLHRLLAQVENLRACDALIVCAGMEGALPSVVAGLVDVPVVAVPTSVGYGASFGGLAALLGMLNSCANGVAVVNIDNGFGAAAFVATMLKRGAR